MKNNLFDIDEKVILMKRVGYGAAKAAVANYTHIWKAILPIFVTRTVLVIDGGFVAFSI